ncbi:MAG: hypothetical protein ACOCQ4_02555 [bacterium]
MINEVARGKLKLIILITVCMVGLVSLLGLMGVIQNDSADRIISTACAAGGGGGSGSSPCGNISDKKTCNSHNCCRWDPDIKGGTCVDDCPTDKPYCVNDKCVECRNDGDCKVQKNKKIELCNLQPKCKNEKCICKECCKDDISKNDNYFPKINGPKVTWPSLTLDDNWLPSIAVGIDFSVTVRYELTCKHDLEVVNKKCKLEVKKQWDAPTQKSGPITLGPAQLGLDGFTSIDIDTSKWMDYLSNTKNWKNFGDYLKNATSFGKKVAKKVGVVLKILQALTNNIRNIHSASQIATGFNCNDACKNF